jgi:hypothetical protein
MAPEGGRDNYAQRRRSRPGSLRHTHSESMKEDLQPLRHTLKESVSKALKVCVVRTEEPSRTTALSWVAQVDQCPTRRSELDRPRDDCALEPARNDQDHLERQSQQPADLICASAGLDPGAASAVTRAYPFYPVSASTGLPGSVCFVFWGALPGRCLAQDSRPLHDESYVETATRP